MEPPSEVEGQILTVRRLGANPAVAESFSVLARPTEGQNFPILSMLQTVTYSKLKVIKMEITRDN